MSVDLQAGHQLFCCKRILGTHEENESVGSMEKFVVITQGKGCLVRAQMCRTDNTFSLWLMRPGFSESQICKARGLTSTDVKWFTREQTIKELVRTYTTVY